MADPAKLAVKVVSSGSETLSVSVPSLATATVRSLKQLIEAQDVQRFPLSAQRLIFQGQILQDDKRLSEYSIADGCALHLTLAPSAVRAAAPSPAASASPSSVETQLRALLQEMRADAGYATAAQTMQKICENVVNHPHEEKYRKLRLGNAALKSRLLDRVRGLDCVKLLGFQGGIEEGHLVLMPTAEKWENLVAGKRVLDEAVAAASTPSGFGGAGASNWAAQAQSVLQNPMMAQTLQSDPMVQHMAQLSPMLAQVLQNPSMLSQQLQMLQQNPAMMQQVTQLMQDPSAMARVQQMLGSGSGAGSALSGSLFGAAPSSAAASPFAPSVVASNPFAPSAASVAPVASAASPSFPAASAANGGGGDNSGGDASFDEDEIADAIARSLQDHS